MLSLVVIHLRSESPLTTRPRPEAGLFLSMPVVPFAEQHPHIPSVVQVRLVATRANADNLPRGATPRPTRRGFCCGNDLLETRRKCVTLHLTDGLREEACQPG
jgi:hypothetical protein